MNDRVKQNRFVLHFLLVLSIAFAGLNVMAHIGMSILLPQVKEVFEADTTILPEQVQAMMSVYVDLPQSYYLAIGLLYLVELIGAVLMWSLRTSGFHCYTLARLLLLLVPLLFLGKGFLGLGDVMMALLYIVVYWMILKQLGAFNRNDQQNLPTEQ